MRARALFNPLQLPADCSASLQSGDIFWREMKSFEETWLSAILLASAWSEAAGMGKDGIDEHIAAGARAVAAALDGPAGQIPLDRIVIHHLAWFDLCQERGMTWSQMALLLRNAGAGRENGQPFTPGHLSSVVWRQRQKSAGGQARSVSRSSPPALAVAGYPEARQPSLPHSRKTASPPPVFSIPAQLQFPPVPPPEPAPSDVRAMMRRAAQLRNQRFDDEE
ncbi:hypothetical protein ACXIUS_25115 [Bosea thiooxidans]